MVTTLDIAWFAGILEGEGCFITPTGNRRSESVQITQKEPWILNRIAELFGGLVRVHKQTSRSGVRLYHRWSVFGPRARGIAMTVFSFMSPHRKTQIKGLLAGRADYVKGSYRHLFGEPAVPDNQNPLVLCACGCEQVIRKFTRRGKVKRFIIGHNPKR